jgi:anti-sigma-K factor RskA
MSSNLDLHHLAAAYALDALDADERIAFEAHYHDCHVCSHDVGDFRATLATLGELSVTVPPTDMKARVLQQISVTRQLSPLVSARSLAARPTRRPSLLAAAAALLVLVASAAFMVGRGSQTDDAFASQLEQVLAEPDVQMVDLAATSAATDGHIRVAWSATARKAAVIADGLSLPNGGAVYELWLIDESGAVPTGMLDAANNGEVRRILTMTGVPVKWGITIEPEDGSASPTGEVLFLGDA